MRITNRVTFYDWVDIAFTALPLGRINVYENNDSSVFTEPCPGVLLQEATTVTRCWDEVYDDGRVEHRSKDSCVIRRETRAAYAAAGCRGHGGSLQAADDADNYLVTTTPEHWETGIPNSPVQEAVPANPAPSTNGSAVL